MGAAPGRLAALPATSVESMRGCLSPPDGPPERRIARTNAFASAMPPPMTTRRRLRRPVFACSFFHGPAADSAATNDAQEAKRSPGSGASACMITSDIGPGHVRARLREQDHVPIQHILRQPILGDRVRAGLPRCRADQQPVHSRGQRPLIRTRSRFGEQTLRGHLAAGSPGSVPPP